MDTNILLLEDDESLRRAVSLKLSKEGYTVYTAADIKTGTSLYNSCKMSLIICDISLPDGSGLDFCAQIRRESDILILFLTALDTEPDMIKGYEAGGDDYITKPFSLAVFVSKVNAMMKRHSPETGKTVIRSGIPPGNNSIRASNCSPATDMRKRTFRPAVCFTAAVSPSLSAYL